MDGVLGGYGHVDDGDVKGSEAFLKPLLLDRFGSGARHPVALGKPLSCRSFAVNMSWKMPVRENFDLARNNDGFNNF